MHYYDYWYLLVETDLQCDCLIWVEGLPLVTTKSSCCYKRGAVSRHYCYGSWSFSVRLVVLSRYCCQTDPSCSSSKRYLGARACHFSLLVKHFLAQWWWDSASSGCSIFSWIASSSLKLFQTSFCATEIPFVSASLPLSGDIPLYLCSRSWTSLSLASLLLISTLEML